MIGARSGVVIKTPTGDVQERSIKAGTINIIGLKKEVDVDVDEGADKIMEAISSIQEIDDIQGETGTNVGNMLNKVAVLWLVLRIRVHRILRFRIYLQ